MASSVQCVTAIHQAPVCYSINDKEIIKRKSIAQQKRDTKKLPSDDILLYIHDELLYDEKSLAMSN